VGVCRCVREWVGVCVWMCVKVCVRDFVLLVALAESPQVCVGGGGSDVCERERDFVLLFALAESLQM